MWKQVQIEGKEPGVVPQPRLGHTMTPVRHQIYMFGGKAGGQVTNELWIFDTKTNKWINTEGKATGSLPGPRHRHGALYIKKLDRLIIFGGVEGGANLHVLEPNYPERLAWTTPSTQGLNPSSRFSFYMDLRVIKKKPPGFLPNGQPDTSLKLNKNSAASNALAETELKVIIFGGKSNQDTLNDYYELILPERVRDPRDKSNEDLDYQPYLPHDSKIMDECPWRSFVDRGTGRLFFYNTENGETTDVDPTPEWLENRKKELKEQVKQAEAELKLKRKELRKTKAVEEVWRWEKPEFKDGIPPVDCSRAVVILDNGFLRVFGAEEHTEYVLDTDKLIWNRYHDEKIFYPLKSLTSFGQTSFDGEHFALGGVKVRTVEEEMFTWTPESRRWVKMPYGGILPPARFKHAVCTVGYTIYVTFGVDRAKYHTDMWSFDATPLPWTRLAYSDNAPPGMRVNAQAVVNLFDKVRDANQPDTFVNRPVAYMVGGASAGEARRDIRRLDLESKDWELINVDSSSDVVPEALVSHSTVAYHNKLFVFAGGNGKTANNHLYVFNCFSRRWEYFPTIGAPPAARLGHAACVLKGSMWIFGGFMSNMYFSDIHHLSFGSRTWLQEQPRGIRPPPRFAHSMASPVNGEKLYIFGGISTGQKPMGDLWIMDTTDLQWERCEPEGFGPQARYAHACHFINDKMFVFGGGGGSKDTRVTFDDLFVLDTGREKLVWSQPRVALWKPPARSRMCSFVHGNRFYIYGGGNGTVHYDDLCCLITNEEPDKRFELQLTPRVPGFEEPVQETDAKKKKDKVTDKVKEKVKDKKDGAKASDSDDDDDDDDDDTASDSDREASRRRRKKEKDLVVKFAGDAQDEPAFDDDEPLTTSRLPTQRDDQPTRPRPSKAAAVGPRNITRADDQRAFEGLLVKYGLGQYVRRLRKEEIYRDTFLRLSVSELSAIDMADPAHHVAVRSLQRHLMAIPDLPVPRGKPIWYRRVMRDRYLLCEAVSWGGTKIITAIDHGQEDGVLRNVAIKVHTSLQSFRHEVHMFKNAPRQFIAPLVEAIEDVPDLGHCVVLEHARTLSEYIATARITASERKSIIEQLLAMLGHFHKEGGVMCTLSPKILGEYGYEWRIVNCEGMRRHMDAVPTVFDACYAAPELINTLSHTSGKSKKDQEVSRATRRMDTWSLGLIMFELFTQEPMFAHEQEAISAAGGKGLVLASTLGAVDDVQARHLIEQCLQPKPRDRIAIRNIAEHAYLRGGFDNRQMQSTFGSLKTGFQLLEDATKSLLDSHEKRKQRLQNKLREDEELEMRQRELKRLEEERAAAEKPPTLENLWETALQDEDQGNVLGWLANPGGLLKKQQPSRNAYSAADV